jgi:glutamate synthase (NADPH/NADH) small chain
MAQMEAEGVTFHCNRHVGVDTDVAELERTYDAVLLAGGSEAPRDLPVPGRELDGVHFAMDFLRQQNKRVARRIWAMCNRSWLRASTWW